MSDLTLNAHVTSNKTCGPTEYFKPKANSEVSKEEKTCSMVLDSLLLPFSDCKKPSSGNTGTIKNIRFIDSTDPIHNKISLVTEKINNFNRKIETFNALQKDNKTTEIPLKFAKEFSELRREAIGVYNEAIKLLNKEPNSPTLNKELQILKKELDNLDKAFNNVSEKHKTTMDKVKDYLEENNIKVLDYISPFSY